MQTRLRSRLGLSGTDALPEPVRLRSAAHATSSSVKRVSRQSDTAATVLDGGGGPENKVAPAPSALGLSPSDGSDKFARVTRRRAAAVLVAAASPRSSSVTLVDDDCSVVTVDNSAAAATSARRSDELKSTVNPRGWQPRDSASVSPISSDSALGGKTHSRDIPAAGPTAHFPIRSSRRSTTQDSTTVLDEPAATKIAAPRDGGRRNVAPRSVWRQVFTNAAASRGPNAPQTQKSSTRLQLQRSLQSAVDEALGRARHEQRMRLIAENQESEFLVDLLQEKRERKRLRYEARRMATPNRKVVLVDSDASDGIGGEESVAVTAGVAVTSATPPPGAHRRCSTLQLRPNHSGTTHDLRFDRRRSKTRREESEEEDGNTEECVDEEDDAADKILRVMDALDKQFRLFDATRDAAAAKRSEQRGAGGRRRLRLAPQPALSQEDALQQSRGGGGGSGVPSCVTASPSQVTCAVTSAQSFARLMPFQREGVHWMMETMTQHHWNVILADDMGLGKTVSTIALMRALVNLHELFVDAHPLPSTVVEPTETYEGRGDSGACGNHNKAKQHSGAGLTPSEDVAARSSTSSHPSTKEDAAPMHRRPRRGNREGMSFLASLHETYRHHVVKPMLVVAPLSTLPNWEREFTEFEPNAFDVFVINGTRAEREDAVERFLERVQHMWGERVHRSGRFHTSRSKRTVRQSKKKYYGGRNSSGVKSGGTTAAPLVRRLVLWGAPPPVFSSSSSAAVTSSTTPPPAERASHAKVRVPVLVLPHGYFVDVGDWRGRALLETVQWQLVVMDEAQRIKNNSCKLFQVMSQISSPLRLVLTGTPLQNNVLEMFALLEFILPQRFYSKDPATKRLMLMLHEALTQTSERAETNFVDEELEMLLCRRVHRFLAPFLLRREKSAVLSQLPVKDDVMIVCPVTPLQTAYLAAAERRRDAKKLSGSFTLLVRKILMHPYLCLNSFYVDERVVYASGKFVVLDILIRFLNRFQHKVLVFSTWTTMLDVVESLCNWRSVSCVRLEGKTAVPDREHNIRKFSEREERACDKREGGDCGAETFSSASAAERDSNACSECGDSGADEVRVSGVKKNLMRANWNPSSPDIDVADSVEAAGPRNPQQQKAVVNCFLISKIAGGVGLNLQVADTVILLDVDYNPQRDLQALSRVYRVGQTKHVKVFRLVMNHAVEEHIVQIALRKQRLDEAVVQAGLYDLRSSAVDRDEHVRSLFERMRSAANSGPPLRVNVTLPCEAGDHAAAAAAAASNTANGKPSEECKIEEQPEQRPRAQQPLLRWAEEECGGTWEGLVSDQLMETVPRSAEEQAALCEMLCEHWQQLRSCTATSSSVVHEDGGGDDERKFLAA